MSRRQGGHQPLRGYQPFLQVNKPQTPKEEVDMFKFPYWEAMGALMSTAMITRPDIACAVRAVARFCKNPRPAHKKAVMKIF